MPQDFSKYADYLNLLAPAEPNSTPVPQTFDPAHPESFAKYLEVLKPQPQTPQPSPAETIASTLPVVRQPRPMPVLPAKEDDSDKTPTTVAPVAPSVVQSPLDFTGTSISSNENLANALQTQGNMNLAANLGRSADKIGSAIARTPDQENSVYKSIDQQAAQIPGQYQQLAANEKNDSNSQISKGFRSFVENKLGTPLKGEPSAGDLEKVIPSLFKDYEARLSEKGKLEQKKAELQNKKEIAAENRQAKKDIAEMVQGNKASAAEEKKGADKEKHQSQTLQQTQNFLESSRNLPDVRQALMDKYNINKAEAILKNRDLNNLSGQEVGLLVSELSKVARGGVPTQEELHVLSPNTLTGYLSKQYSRLMNEPTPAHAGEFLKQYQRYMQELKSNAEDTISKKVKRVIETRKKDLGEDNYNVLQDQYQDLLNPGGATSRNLQSNSASSSEDQAAIDWAKKNPNDPRAQQILKMHGM